MAAPPDVTILDLNGKWVMDKFLSTPMDPLLSLQGMSWITRKAISLATITLTISEYTKTDPTTGKEVIYIESVQKATGGLAGTKEVHVCDWSEVENSDPIFGQVVARDRFFWGSTAPDGTIRPDIDIQTQTGGDLVRKFLRGEILADGSDSDGFLMDGHQDVNLGDGQGLWLQGFGDNRDARWTVEQVSGFETINGERHHTRRVVVAKGDKYECARLVYRFLGR